MLTATIQVDPEIPDPGAPYVNRPAIHDLLGSILSTWYQRAAAWAPPGWLSAHTCETCSTSLLADAIDVAVWPHDLMHDLASSLNTGVMQISESWAEDGCEDGLDEDGRMLCVFTLVRTTIIDHRDDVLDVLNECVEPRMSEYLAAESTRGIDEFAAWSEEQPGR